MQIIFLGMLPLPATVEDEDEQGSSTTNVCIATVALGGETSR